jgi:hypothetical protein
MSDNKTIEYIIDKLKKGDIIGITGCSTSQSSDYIRKIKTRIKLDTLNFNKPVLIIKKMSELKDNSTIIIKNLFDIAVQINKSNPKIDSGEISETLTNKLLCRRNSGILYFRNKEKEDNKELSNIIDFVEQTILDIIPCQERTFIKTVSGRITDKQGESLVGVKVRLPDYNQICNSDNNGAFSFKIKIDREESKETFAISAEKEGFKKWKDFTFWDNTDILITMESELGEQKIKERSDYSFQPPKVDGKPENNKRDRRNKRKQSKQTTSVPILKTIMVAIVLLSFIVLASIILYQYTGITAIEPFLCFIIIIVFGVLIFYAISALPEEKRPELLNKFLSKFLPNISIDISSIFTSKK